MRNYLLSPNGLERKVTYDWVDEKTKRGQQRTQQPVKPEKEALKFNNVIMVYPGSSWGVHNSMTIEHESSKRREKEAQHANHKLLHSLSPSAQKMCVEEKCDFDTKRD